MIKRIYVHNFRCLQNFEFSLSNENAILLIGKNGSGKSTISAVLEILQRIGQGVNSTDALFKKDDFSFNAHSIPMRFEIEVLLSDRNYKYELALELPENFHSLRILEEKLSINGKAAFERKYAEVTINKNAAKQKAQFSIDWHLVGLPIIFGQSENDPLNIFKNWLSKLVILSPIPSLMTGLFNKPNSEIQKDGSNIGAWLSGLLGKMPAAYTKIDQYLKQIFDLEDFQIANGGVESQNWVVNFSNGSKTLSVNFANLSDGEKCYFLSAIVTAALSTNTPIFCFWDEPDNYLSLSEVGHFVLELRKAFKKNNGQIIVTSHNPEAIRKFSENNTYVLERKSHLEPTQLKLLQDFELKGDLINSLILGDL